MNELALIPGIGEKTIEILMRRFKSVTRLKSASSDDIIQLIGNYKAEKLHQYFQYSSDMN